MCTNSDPLVADPFLFAMKSLSEFLSDNNQAEVIEASLIVKITGQSFEH